MTKDDDRERQRLSDWAEQLDQLLAKETTARREFEKRIDQTLYGDQRPLGQPGLVRQWEIMAARDHLWKRRIKWVLITCGTIGAFTADVAKDVIKEALHHRLWRSPASEFMSERGKKRVKVLHIRCVENPAPVRRTIKETDTQILEDIYMDKKIGGDEC